MIRSSDRLADQQQGVDALADFAMHATGAQGYELRELDPRGMVLRQSGRGGPISIPTVSDDSRTIISEGRLTIVCYFLRQRVELVGSLAFAFQGDKIDHDKLVLLDQLAEWLSQLCAIRYATVQIALRIGEVDAELAGLKVAERTRGLVMQKGESRQMLALLDRHVSRVVQARTTPMILNSLLELLEDRLEERKLLAEAKAHLERFGMTEEQAYLHLRKRSRASRKRLRLVAQELIRAHEPA